MKDDFQNGELYESRFAFKARKAVFTTLVVLLVLILLIGTLQSIRRTITKKNCCFLQVSYKKVPPTFLVGGFLIIIC